MADDSFKILIVITGINTYIITSVCTHFLNIRDIILVSGDIIMLLS